MNCKQGDLAYVVAPPGFKRTFHLRFCTLKRHGVDDLTPRFTGKEWPDSWFCVWQTPVEFEGRTIRGNYMLDSWLRPIRDPGDDAVDETLREIEHAL